jgi:vacuolar-type H+-ATPase subunit E/Vma4
MVAVPSAGDELSREVDFLFADLDEIAGRGAHILAAARAEADEIAALAVQQRQRLLEEAHADSERVSAELLAERRESCERAAQMLLAAAEREAARVLDQGRERTPQLVEQVISRLLEGAP